MPRAIKSSCYRWRNRNSLSPLRWTQYIFQSQVVVNLNPVSAHESSPLRWVESTETIFCFNGPSASPDIPLLNDNLIQSWKFEPWNLLPLLDMLGVIATIAATIIEHGVLVKRLICEVLLVKSLWVDGSRPRKLVYRISSQTLCHLLFIKSFLGNNSWEVLWSLVNPQPSKLDGSCSPVSWLIVWNSIIDF